MTCAELIEHVEMAGGMLVLNGERIRVHLPEEAAHLLEELRAHKDEVLSLLRGREKLPSMPPGVRLLHWEPKPAPVILAPYLVVTGVDRFVRMTLIELKAALAGKPWQSGHWSVRDLVDRLEQVGVRVEVELKFRNGWWDTRIG
jgi:hypothetical protein